MRCIFCKESSDQSRSREHIIPESLWNRKHVLPPGIVCDNCNHYFAIKVEKPVLDSEYFTRARFWHSIPNKKGRIPTQEIIGPNGEDLRMYRTPKGWQGVYPIDAASERSFLSHVFARKGGMLTLPAVSLPDMRLVARLLAKSAIEILAHRIIGIDQWQEQMVDKRELDELRNYARYGLGPTWPFYERRIYPAGLRRFRNDGSSYETMHEFDMLLTEEQELFVVICLLGVEFTLNAGRRDLSGYECWLEHNRHASPLYPKGRPNATSASD